MNDKQKSLRAQIAELEKEISVLRLLSQEKDVAIAEKEKRIYELKKKNQVRKPCVGVSSPHAIIVWLLLRAPSE